MRVWYSRGYLPHYDEPGKVQFITYRLQDALPKVVLESYDEALHRGENDSLGRKRRIERYLDKGHGTCWLRRPQVAEMGFSIAQFYAWIPWVFKGEYT